MIKREVYDIYSLNNVLNELGLPLNFNLTKQDIPKILKNLEDSVLIEYEEKDNETYIVYFGFDPVYRQELYLKKKSLRR